MMKRFGAGKLKERQKWPAKDPSLRRCVISWKEQSAHMGLGMRIDGAIGLDFSPSWLINIEDLYALFVGIGNTERRIRSCIHVSVEQQRNRECRWFGKGAQCPRSCCYRAIKRTLKVHSTEGCCR